MWGLANTWWPCRWHWWCPLVFIFLVELMLCRPVFLLTRALRLPWILSPRNKVLNIYFVTVWWKWPAREVMESGTITSTTLHWHASSHPDDDYHEWVICFRWRWSWWWWWQSSSLPCTFINSLFSFFLLLFLVCHKQRLSFFRFLSSLAGMEQQWFLWCEDFTPMWYKGPLTKASKYHVKDLWW